MSYGFKEEKRSSATSLRLRSYGLEELLRSGLSRGAGRMVFNLRNEDPFYGLRHNQANRNTDEQ